ncbi:NADH-quinone oxidoreductase subunit M [Sodalinema gerasimenkoae]|uniref:NADH-quinone oxidoreductase subunit M n=1 Tax=Sodalinema gerasimenkoae TaxID=2862348 RepID=UPI0013589FCA|nr:NADH-quinone oxidoreductase subunit M [Sodalinema gerasimenkoae]
MLSALLLIPLIAAILICLLPQSLPSSRFRSISFVVLTIIFGLSLGLMVNFDPYVGGMQFTEQMPWVDWLGLSYHLGVDGISLPLIILNQLLTAIAILSSPDKLERPRLYYALMLVLNLSVTGAFLSLDLLLFFIFYELELIPLYLLIAIWGGARRNYAATKFLLYTATSGIFILAAFLGLVWLTGASTFDYTVLAPGALPMGSQLILLTGLFIGFAIKIPIFPFHTWLPDAHVEASTSVSVLLAGVLLKLGTYGLLRFCVGMLPEAWSVAAPVLVIFAVISVLYGALTAISQQDMKKMVAYSSIAHMGYILLAAAAGTHLSLLAAIAQSVSHGLISAMLFLLVGVVGKKTGTRDIDKLCGLLNPERGLPIIGSLMIVGVMASAGIPGMVGFVSEFLVFRGSFPVFPVATLLCLVGTGLTAVYFLLMVNRVFFGRLSDTVMNLPPVQWGDRVPVLVLTVLLVVFGVQPNWLVRWSDADAARLVPPVAVVQLSSTADVPPFPSAN